MVRTYKQYRKRQKSLHDLRKVGENANSPLLVRMADIALQHGLTIDDIESALGHALNKKPAPCAN